MKVSFILIMLFTLFVVAPPVCAQNKAYYISSSGNNANNGLSPSTAWADLTKVNATTFFAGDSILFQAGQTFSGNIQLESNTNGTSANPIFFGSFGSGKATISSGANAGFYAHSSGGITIKNLIFKGDAMSDYNTQGVFFYNENASSEMTAILLDSLEVYGYGGNGIFFMSGTTTDKGFSNVTIQHCAAHDNGLSGIFTYGTNEAYTNHNFTLRYCSAYNNYGQPLYTNGPSGNGILVSGMYDAVIEYCEAYNNGQNNTHNGGPVGIWVYDAKNVTIQFCESHHNKAGAQKDGGGFDIDGGSQNCTIQYCYSHDNEGAGYGLFEFGSPNAFTGNTVRYNISQNDGRKNGFGALSLWGVDAGHPISNSQVYNNTFYVDNSSGITDNVPGAVQLVLPNMNGITVKNNIFYVTGGAYLVNATDAMSTSAILFQDNDFYDQAGAPSFTWGSAVYSSLSAWQGGTSQEMMSGMSAGHDEDPLLSWAGSGGTINPVEGGNLTYLAGYQLQKGSPMIDQGLTLSNMGAHDYFLNPVPVSNKYDIGAAEYLGGILHASLLDFSGQLRNSEAYLYWSMPNESNIAYYDLMRSADGINFSTVRKITASGSNNYSFSDLAAAEMTAVYYQLKIVNKNGSVMYSSVINLSPSTRETLGISADGNEIRIRFSSIDGQNAWFRVYDITGKEMYNGQFKTAKGNNEMMISNTAGWASGIYIIQSSVNGGSIAKFFK